MNHQKSKQKRKKQKRKKNKKQKKNKRIRSQKKILGFGLKFSYRKLGSLPNDYLIYREGGGMQTLQVDRFCFGFETGDDDWNCIFSFLFFFL